MTENLKPLTFGAFCLLNLTACSPPGYETAAFTSVNWPSSDQAVTLEQRIEVEGRLRALKYLSEPADGVLTKSTRLAIRAFQTDIGAPVTGFVSVLLLDALQTNSAFLTPSELQKAMQGSILEARGKQPVPVASAKKRTRQSDGLSGEADASVGGGDGGAGAGAWN